MMKLTLFAGVLAGVIALHGQAACKTKVAPADEYFGRQKMSILGITNTIHDVGIRVGNDPAHGAKYYGSLLWTEEALEDWARKYPQDAWIPQRAYTMSHVLWQMHTPDADAMADRCRNVLFAQFPRSPLASLARTESSAKVAPLNLPVAANAPTKN